MVDTEKYKWHLLLVAFILTVVVFFAGIALGWTIDNFRVNAITTAIKQSELNTESFLLESQFIENFGGDYCQLSNLRIKDLQKNIAETGKRLSTWSETKQINESDFDYLKRKYVLLEIKFLFLLQDASRMCGKSYDTILFFYNIDDGQSLKQGYALDDLKLKKDDIIVLSFDKNYVDEPLINILLTKYSIDSAPAIVINGKNVLIGYNSPQQIEEFL